MIELSKERYNILLEPVLKVPFNILMARSVISMHVDGRIFVDSRETPHSFYIIHPYGMTYLCGNSKSNTFNEWLAEYFKGNSFERTKDEWLQAYPRDWDILMNTLIDNNIAERYNRSNFIFYKERFLDTFQQINKPQYEIISTPIDMLFEINGSVVPKYYWNAPEQFADMAKAFSVVIEGKPVSTAFTSAIHDNKLEIGIETKEEYYGKGLAYLACAKLIEYCLANGLEPVWACRYENVASFNLCKKLGFDEVLRMPYYHIPMN